MVPGYRNFLGSEAKENEFQRKKADMYQRETQKAKEKLETNIV
jgi:hypothetical protein